MTKPDRIIIANQVIGIIQEHGQKFFTKQDRTGLFALGIVNGKLYWRSERDDQYYYMGKYFKLHYGNSLCYLLRRLAKYIRGMEDFPIEFFDPKTDVLMFDLDAIKVYDKIKSLVS